MRVLIVEDEDNVREGLLTMVDWNAEGFDGVDSCGTAMDALDIMADRDVDLVITDILMPVISGIEFVRIAKKQNPQAMFIILSGHDSFEYAQEAIELGVHRYLLKPVTPVDLATVVREIYRELVEARVIKNWMYIAEQKLNEYLPIVVDQFWNDLINRRIRNMEELTSRANTAGITIKDGNFICLALRVMPDGLVNEYDSMPLSRRIAIRQIVSEFLNDELLYVADPGGQLQLVILSCGITDRLLEDLRVSIETNLEISICFGVGRQCSVLANLHESVNDAIEAVNSIRRSGKHVIVKYEDIMLWKKKYTAYPYALEKEMLDMLQFHDKFDVTPLHKFLEAVFPPHNSPATAKLMLLQFLVTIYRFADEYSVSNSPPFSNAQESLKDFDHTEKYLECLLDSIMNEKNQSHQKFVSVMANQARQIIDADYSDPELSVSAIARRLCVSANYLSHIFHGETGQTCMEYMTSVRLNTAKELLLHSSIKSYEIAERVGYNNPNYFSALFKKRTGLSPREYRGNTQC